MHFNRINGFWVGKWPRQEFTSMNLDDRNLEINKALEARFTQLNAAIEAQEAKLKEMMVARNAQHCYWSCGDDDPNHGTVGEYQHWLGMIKLRGVWRLCHATHYESYSGGYPEEIDWKPLVEASIEDRIKAAAHIEKLRAAIVESKEKLVPDLEKAIETLAKTLA